MPNSPTPPPKPPAASLANANDHDMPALHKLHAQFSTSLSAFAASSSIVQILHTHPPSSTNQTSTPPPAPSPTHPVPTRQLLVLDSSFNPPSRAHAYVARSAVLAALASKAGPPPRLLLLLATQNADKAPQPASFADRVVMMSLFAEELARSVREATKGQGSDGEGVGVGIDCGVTKKAYFIDKAEALDGSGIYVRPEDGDEGGEGERVVQQTHLAGFDTLIRIFNPKYYGDKGLGALEGFLSRHRVRAMVRPEEGEHDAERQRQMAWLGGLRGADGFREEWMERVEVVDGDLEAEGVSSTRVREGVRKGNWESVGDLVGEGVAAWIRERRLYLEDEDG